MREDWIDDARAGWDILEFEGEVQWFAKRTSPSRTLGGRLRGIDSLFGTIRNAEALGWDLYLNANPTYPRPGVKLRRSDVSAWRHLVVDMDPTEHALAPPEPHWIWAAHRIFSGRGYQYWMPRHMWAETDSKLDIAERLMSGYLRHLAAGSEEWAPGWRVDTTCSDLARVVRCPGSVNQRTGKRAVVERLAPDLPRFTSDDLMPYISPEPEPVIAQFTESVRFIDVLPHLNGRARQFIQSGVESPGRHAACFATCKQLHELGLPRATAEHWVKLGASRCYEMMSMDDGHGNMAPVGISMHLPSPDVDRIIHQIYGGAECTESGSTE